MLRVAPLLLLVACLVGQSASGGDWISEPSYYTHGPDGQRVTQHTPIGPFFIYVDPTYQRSGYRHTRSSLQMGGSADHYHSVEEWGRPVRPYDEWRFPYRPYSAPYDQWGPPYGGLGGWPFTPWGAFPGIGFGPGGPGGFGPGGFGPGPFGHGGGGGGNWGGGPNGSGAARTPYPGYQPWFDDRYPAFDDRSPWRHRPHPVLPPAP